MCIERFLERLRAAGSLMPAASAVLSQRHDHIGVGIFDLKHGGCFRIGQLQLHQRLRRQNLQTKLSKNTKLWFSKSTNKSSSNTCFRKPQLL